MSDVTLRAATIDDWDFVAAVTETCMRGYCEQTWGQWRADAPDSFDPDIHRVIRLGGDDIGCLALIDDPESLNLKTLYILPAYQGRGIGTTLMLQIIDGAELQGKPIELRVLRVNPARRFYERHGFLVTNSTHERHFMTRRADTVPPTNKI